MKFLIISNDNELIEQAKSVKPESHELELCSHNFDPLDIVSAYCSNRVNAIFIDDDFVSPNTLKVMQSLRNFNKNLLIVFLTSNESIELGKSILPLGVHFYGLKPLSEKFLPIFLNQWKS